MTYGTQRANWKDRELMKIFLDACIEVNTSRKTNGSAMRKQSWDIIGKTIKEKKGLTLSYKQMKNQWDYLKKKYSIWEKIVNKTGSVKWTAVEWDEYIKANPDAKQFRYAGLQYANEMKSLFDGTGATSREGMPECDPIVPMIDFDDEDVDVEVDLSNSTMPHVQRPKPKGRKANTDEMIDFDVDADVDVEVDLSNSTMPHVQRSKPKGRKPNTDERIDFDDDVDVEVDLSNSTMSPVQRSKPKGRKANTDESIDDSYKVLKTSKYLEEPSFEDCYKVLNELLDEGDPLYIVACAIFCENKMYKEVWMTLTKNSDYVRKNWLTMVGKRFGLI